MSSPPRKKSDRPKQKPSGEHAAVKEMRAKFESIQDGTLAEVEALNVRISHELERVKASTAPPPCPTCGGVPDKLCAACVEAGSYDVIDLERDPFPTVPPPPEKKP